MKKKTQTKKNIGLFSHMLVRLWGFMNGLNILEKLKKVLFFSLFLFVFFPNLSFAYFAEYPIGNYSDNCYVVNTPEEYIYLNNNFYKLAGVYRYSSTTNVWHNELFSNLQIMSSPDGDNQFMTVFDGYLISGGETPSGSHLMVSYGSLTGDWRYIFEGYNRHDNGVTVTRVNCSDIPVLIDGVCGADHFYCLQGISTSYPNASTTAWIWTCDGENGGTTAQCFELFSPTSTATTTYPTYTDEECNITSGSGVLGCLKNAFYWAIIPPQSVFDKFNSLIDVLKKKAPMGYFTAYYSAFEFNTSSTPAILALVSSESPLMMYIFNPLRDILVIIIYVFGAVWLFRRVKNINI